MEKKACSGIVVFLGIISIVNIDGYSSSFDVKRTPYARVWVDQEQLSIQLQIFNEP